MFDYLRRIVVPCRLIGRDDNDDNNKNKNKKKNNNIRFELGAGYSRRFVIVIVELGHVSVPSRYGILVLRKHRYREQPSRRTLEPPIRV